MEQSTRIKKEEIPFGKLEKIGVKPDFIKYMDDNELRDFLNGFRSQKLYTVKATINDEQMRIPAKLRLKKEADGTVDVKVHPIQRLQVPEEFMGHKFSQEERNRLLAERNLGKTVELTDRDGKKDRYYMSLDSKTNELIPLRTRYITIPDKIKGVTLSAEQKEKLASGQKVYLDKMTSRNGRRFGAALQVDAANRSINFSEFRQEKKQVETQSEEKSKARGAKQKVS